MNNGISLDNLTYENFGQYALGREKKSWDVFYGGSPTKLLTEAQCKEFCDRLKATKEQWTQRHFVVGRPYSFHTIGAVSYIDAMQSEATYQAEKIKHRQYQLDVFSDLYEILCAKISEIMGGEAVISEDLSPPGFHIFHGNPEVDPSLLGGGILHRDTAHLSHKHRYPHMSEEVFSLTLALELPKGPAGMYYWPQEDITNDYLKFPAELPPEKYQWMNDNKSEVTYEVGNMYMHDSLTIHQGAAMCETDDDDWRITLQGHGIFYDNKWHLYF